MKKIFVIGLVLTMSSAFAQRGGGLRQNNAAPSASDEKPEEGIPVTDALVIE